MSMPAELRTMTVAQLQEHGQNEFKVELTGTKPKMLAQLKELYERRVTSEDTVTDSDDADDADDADEVAEAVEAAPASKPKPAVRSGYMTEPKASEAPKNHSKQVAPEVVPYNGASVKRWPDSVEWLLNPATGKRWRATDILRERMDLVPCDPPEE